MHTVEDLRVVDWRSGNISDSAPSYIIGAVAVGLNLGRTLDACGGGKTPVYGLWSTDSFNKPSFSVRQRWVRMVSDARDIKVALTASFLRYQWM